MTYVPGIPGHIEDVDELRQFVERELLAISRVLNGMTSLELRVRNAAPARPKAGMIVSADGTNWNPGGGAGAYQYVGGAWVKL